MHDSESNLRLRELSRTIEQVLDEQNVRLALISEANQLPGQDTVAVSAKALVDMGSAFHHFNRAMERSRPQSAEYHED